MSPFEFLGRLVMSITDRYISEFPKSQAKAALAREVFPGGVTHDLRIMQPFPIFTASASGAYKVDLDGHTLVDYWAGHGSMLLGHSDPLVVEAVQKQMALCTHAGGNNELELEWGQLVQQLVPCAELVRFTGSGTEATLMALRLSRVFTGRAKFLKFAGHFHGWHDGVTIASDPPYENLSVPGVPDEIAKNTVVLPPNNPELLEATLKEDSQIGAIILEPTGGHWGAVPIRGEFLKTLRTLSDKYGQVLIFDEVITGFRVSPTCAQGYYSVRPDLTTLAKILAGGLPGGAVVGRRDILSAIEVRPGKVKVRHPGTYNGNPLSAAAGIATLKQIAAGTPCTQANLAGRNLRNRLNEMFTREGLSWIAYGDFSMFRLLPNYHGPRPEAATGDANGFIPYEGDIEKLDGPADPKFKHLFRQAMLLNGVDMPGLGGWITAKHSEKEVEKTVNAVRESIRMMEAK